MVCPALSESCSQRIGLKTPIVSVLQGRLRVWSTVATAPTHSDLGGMRQVAGTAQRVAVTGKVWLMQSPQEPLKVAVKSALSVSGLV